MYREGRALAQLLLALPNDGYLEVAFSKNEGGEKYEQYGQGLKKRQMLAAVAKQTNVGPKQCQLVFCSV